MFFFLQKPVFSTKNGLINSGLMSIKQLNKERQPLRGHSSMCQVGLEAAFQVPMPGDSGSRPDVGSIYYSNFVPCFVVLYLNLEPFK